jgi:hypothetical protein
MMLDQHVFQLAGDFVRRYGDDGSAAEAGKALDAARLLTGTWSRTGSGSSMRSARCESGRGTTNPEVRGPGGGALLWAAGGRSHHKVAPVGLKALGLPPSRRPLSLADRTHGREGIHRIPQRSDAGLSLVDLQQGQVPMLVIHSADRPIDPSVAKGAAIGADWIVAESSNSPGSTILLYSTRRVPHLRPAGEPRRSGYWVPHTGNAIPPAILTVALPSEIGRSGRTRREEIPDAVPEGSDPVVSFAAESKGGSWGFPSTLGGDQPLA